MNQLNCIVVLIGLPASGKTSLADKLSSFLLSKNIEVNVFSFDDLCSVVRQAEIANGVSNDSVKDYRLIMKENVEGFIAVTSHRVRRVAIVDDNNYYRSMRYEFYQLAARYKTGFLQIFLQCSSAIAIKFNQSRPQSIRIPKEVIVQMESKLELPSETWENTLTILNEELNNPCMAESIRQRIEEAILSPVILYEIKLQKDVEASDSRLANNRNLMHKTDKILRKLIGRKVQTRNQGIDARVLATNLNINRQLLMERIKLGEVTIPSEVTKANNEIDDGRLESWIEWFFNGM